MHLDIEWLLSFVTANHLRIIPLLLGEKAGMRAGSL
jgi:hypothetical protein